MLIKDFYNLKNSKSIDYSAGYCLTIKDFYNDFILPRIPSKAIVIQWHKLINQYIMNEPNSICFIRKYESTKSIENWNTRRGCVVRFNNFELVYSSNFLAHDIFLMAYNNFCPSYNDFKNMIETRQLRNTIGTKFERDFSLYPGNNKKIKCYLAHISAVNQDEYLRDSGNYCKINRKEAKKLFPIGGNKDWNNSDKTYFTNYSLSSEEIYLIKAHTIRLLDPLNYFVCPQTEHCVHSISNLSKNIGEYEPVINYVVGEYKKMYGNYFDEFIINSRSNLNHSINDGSENISLSYDKSFKVKVNHAHQPTKTNAKITNKDSFTRYLLGIGISSNMYQNAINNLKNQGEDLSYNNLDVLINNYSSYRKDHGTLFNALKRYKEHLIYLELSEMKSIPFRYFYDKNIEKMLIPSNIERLDSNAFENSSIKELYFEKGCLSSVSGSNIFKDCNNLKKVCSKSFEELKFKYDTDGHPYFKRVKVYVNKNLVKPIAAFSIFENYSVFFENSKHIHAIDIVEDECVVTYDENKKSKEIKTIKLNEEMYRMFICLLKRMKNNTAFDFYNSRPSLYDAPIPPSISYSFFDEKESHLKINDFSFRNELIYFLELVTGEKISII